MSKDLDNGNCFIIMPISTPDELVEIYNDDNQHFSHVLEFLFFPALKKAGLREKVKVAIGGACCSQLLAEETGVDAFGEDAVKAVSIFEAFANA